MALQSALRIIAATCAIVGLTLVAVGVAAGTWVVAGKVWLYVF